MRTASEVKDHNGRAEVRAVSVIDAVLAAASHRATYTDDELLSVLNDVVAAVRGSELVEPVLTIVDRAMTALGDQRIVDRGRVVDVLLDLRLDLEPLPDLV